MTDDNDLNSLIDSLSMENVSNQTQEKDVPKTDDDLLGTLMSTMMDMIKTNAQQMKHAQEMSETTGESAHVEAYASVAKSQADLVKTLSTMLLEKEKLKVNTELKNKDLKLKEKAMDQRLVAAKEDVPKLGNGANNIQNNFIFSDTRENAMKMLFSSGEKRDALFQKHGIDVPKEETPPVIEAEVVS